MFPSSKLAAKTVDLECDNGWSLGAPCEGDAVKIGLWILYTHQPPTANIVCEKENTIV